MSVSTKEAWSHSVLSKIQNVLGDFGATENFLLETPLSVLQLSVDKSYFPSAIWFDACWFISWANACGKTGDSLPNVLQQMHKMLTGNYNCFLFILSFSPKWFSGQDKDNDHLFCSIILLNFLKIGIFLYAKIYCTCMSHV